MVENIGFSTVSKFYAKAEPGSADGPVSKMLRCLMVPSMPKHAIQSMLQVNVSILFFVAVFLGCISTGWVGLCFFFVVLCPGTPEGSTGNGSGFKASQKTGQQLKVSSDRLGEAGNRNCDLVCWFLIFHHKSR